MKTDRKLPSSSPMWLRTRQPLRPTKINTPTGSLMKPQMRKPEIRPEPNTISSELRALAQMVHCAEFENCSNYSMDVDISCRNIDGSLGMFERGRFYEQYSARRNERLRKKQLQEDPYSSTRPVCKSGLGVKKKSGDQIQQSRYALRSMAKRPPLPLPTNNAQEKKMPRKSTATTTRPRRI